MVMAGFKQVLCGQGNTSGPLLVSNKLSSDRKFFRELTARNATHQLKANCTSICSMCKKRVMAQTYPLFGAFRSAPYKRLKEDQPYMNHIRSNSTSTYSQKRKEKVPEKKSSDTTSAVFLQTMCKLMHPN